MTWGLQSILDNLVWINTNSIPMMNKKITVYSLVFFPFFRAVRKRLEF